MSWSDNKELSSRANTIDLNSLKKKNIYIYIYIGLMDIGFEIYIQAVENDENKQQ